jgi:AcrR family transcriptional regulator
MKRNPEVQSIRRPGRPSVDRRDEILSVAEALYAEIGFDRATIGDIAGQLGMSPANIYRTFANRRAIDEAIAGKRLTQIEDLAWTHARRLDAPDVRLRNMTHAVHELSRSLFLSADRLNGICAVAAREGWPVVGQFMEGIRGAIRHVLLDGQHLGAFGSFDPEVMAETVVTALIPVWHPLMIEVNQNADLRRSTDLLTDLIIRGVSNKMT